LACASPQKISNLNVDFLFVAVLEYKAIAQKSDMLGQAGSPNTGLCIGT
jgi:hypothetical protein